MTEYLTNCHLQVVAAYYYIHEKKNSFQKVPKKEREGILGFLINHQIWQNFNSLKNYQILHPWY
jgi:hypothetical protein